MARLLSVSGSVSRTALVSGLLCWGSLVACKNQPPPAAEASAEPTPPPPAPHAAAAPAAAAPAAAASSKYSEAPFDVEIQAKGAYTSGQPGTVEIVVNAKPPFHANDKYPYKFKINETPGIKYANLIVDKDAVKVEKTRATVSVPLTPEKIGRAHV